jgi:hypothetical protein
MQAQPAVQDADCLVRACVQAKYTLLARFCRGADRLVSNACPIFLLSAALLGSEKFRCCIRAFPRWRQTIHGQCRVSGQAPHRALKIPSKRLSRNATLGAPWIVIVTFCMNISNHLYSPKDRSPSRGPSRYGRTKRLQSLCPNRLCWRDLLTGGSCSV